MKRSATVMVALAMAFASSARASIDNAGTTAGNFLSVGAGAPALGMGGTAIAMPNGLLGAAWNPAALARLDQTELTMSHASLESQTSQEWVAVGGRLAATSMHWALSGLYNGQGSFDGRDATGLSTGSFGVSDMALGLHVAREFGPVVSAGLGMKYVSEVLGSTSGQGVTFDGGVQVHAGPAAVGVAAQNLGGRMSYGSTAFPFPSNVGLGGAVVLPTGLRLGLDANFPKAYYNDVRAGVEWRWKGLLALRAGYRKELAAPSDDPLTGPTFGFGGGMGAMWVDYGYVIPGQGAGEHRIGITFRPGILRGAGVLGANQPAKREPAKGEGALASATPPAASTPAPAAAAKPAPSSSAPSVAPAPSAPPTASVVPTRDLVGPPAPPPAPLAAVPAPKPAAGPAPAKPADTKSAVPPADITPAPALASAVPVPQPSSVALPTPEAAPKPAAPVKAKKPATVKPTVPATAAPLAAKTASAPATARATTPASAPAPMPQPTAAAVPSSPAPASVPAPVAVSSTPTPAPAPVAPKPSTAAVASSQPRVAPASAPAMAPIVIQRPPSVKVKKGETLADIAKQWGTSPAAIMMENNLVTDKVKAGQELKLPKK